MDANDCMRLAILLAERCNPEDPSTTPKVGAVIAIGSDVMGVAQRGIHDHAEKLALESLPAGLSLSDATVYTTLEPCTQDVRRGVRDDCANRIAAAHVKKVVIGILDPNQGVCGKGLMYLQSNGIEVELFPSELANRILVLNRDFIRAQQSFGIRITNPTNGERIPKPEGKLIVRGTLINAPGPTDEVYAIVRKNNQWWPQGKIIPSEDGQNWTTEVTIGGTGNYGIYIVRANGLGKVLIHHYYKLGDLHKSWRDAVRHKYNDVDFAFRGGLHSPIEFNSLPKGLDAEDYIDIESTDAGQA